MRTVKSLIPSIVLATVAVLGGPALAAPSPEAREEAEPVYLPCGITDAADKVGYFTLPTGDGLIAVDMATGEVLWQTKEANQPLVVAGNRLVARTGRDNRVRVVVLDLNAKGKRLLESEPLALPTWVAVGRPWPYQGQNRRFVAEGRLVRGNLAEVSWWASKGYWGGAAITQEAAKRHELNASGVARVNLETGKVEMLAGDKLGPMPWQSPGFINLQTDRETSLKKLPAEVQAVAKTNKWVAAYLAGPGAYGLAWQGSDQKNMVQAIEVKTGKLLWERLVREEALESHPR